MTSTGCGVLIMARTHDARVRRDGKHTGEAAAADWSSWLWRRPSSDGARCGARDFVRTAPDAVGCPTAVLHVPPESRGRTGALLERGWRSMDSAHRVGSQWGNSSRGVEGDGEAQTCVCGGEGAHARGLLAGRARSNWRRSAGRGPANTTTKAARNTTYELRACSSPMSQLFSMSLGPCLWVGVSGASHLISQRADRPIQASATDRASDTL